ncbi:hypothetical protein GCM10007913_40780 [Devosia yakushimensis]|uniref:Uncharacterized protein n=1 Tax=Devosia yakushimensis TaxID=470028 RepID=A0ABQ5UN27_9HYPH|nr:hypothetical protein GCM10007913_40780 [Devosia yakushimensis]
MSNPALSAWPGDHLGGFAHLGLRLVMTPTSGFAQEPVKCRPSEIAVESIGSLLEFDPVEKLLDIARDVSAG